MADETPSRRPQRRGAAEPQPAGPQPCSACRATGNVFAGSGEDQVQVACPWCQGTGTWEPGYDAQAAGIFPAS